MGVCLLIREQQDRGSDESLNDLGGLLLLLGLENLLDEVEDLRNFRFAQMPLTHLPPRQGVNF